MNLSAANSALSMILVNAVALNSAVNSMNLNVNVPLICLNENHNASLDLVLHQQLDTENHEVISTSAVQSLHYADQ